jgi:type II secretory pathway pseudopilin PulG
VVTALLIVAALATLLAVATRRHERAARTLADAREATRLAEATLTALQTGAPRPAPPSGAAVRITTDPTPVSIPGCRWTTVSVTLNGRTSQLTGITRTGTPATARSSAGGAP